MWIIVDNIQVQCEQWITIIYTNTKVMQQFITIYTFPFKFSPPVFNHISESPVFCCSYQQVYDISYHVM